MLSTCVVEVIRDGPTCSRDSGKATDDPERVIGFQVRVLQESRCECARLRSASRGSMYQGLSRGSRVWRQQRMPLQEPSKLGVQRVCVAFAPLIEPPTDACRVACKRFYVCRPNNVLFIGARSFPRMKAISRLPRSPIQPSQCAPCVTASLAWLIRECVKEGQRCMPTSRPA